MTQIQTAERALGVPEVDDKARLRISDALFNLATTDRDREHKLLLEQFTGRVVLPGSIGREADAAGDLVLSKDDFELLEEGLFRLCDEGALSRDDREAALQLLDQYDPQAG